MKQKNLDDLAEVARALKKDGEITRGYAVLEVKSVNDGDRIIEGIATSPEPDRVGDIIEPLGVSFKNPLPLLWQHQSREPVGQVKLNKPTKRPRPSRHIPMLRARASQDRIDMRGRASSSASC